MAPTKYKALDYVGPAGNEVTLRNNAITMANRLYNDTSPLVQDFSDAARQLLVTPPTIPDLQGLVDAVVASILSELDEDEEESIAVFKALIKSIIDTALLNTTYDITATELDEIATVKAAFIASRESKIDEEMFIRERQTNNELVMKGQINSTRGADIMAREAAKKARLMLEVQNAADEYEITLRREAYQRIYDKMRIKIQAGGIVPQELIKLPNAAYGIFDGILNRLFLSPQQFVSQLPQLLVAAIQSLGDTTRIFQDERFKRVAGSAQSDSNYINLLQAVVSGYGSLIASTGKMATFEGS